MLRPYFRIHAVVHLRHRVTVLQELKEGSQITLKGTRTDGSTYEITLNHTYNNNQVRRCI